MSGYAQNGSRRWELSGSKASIEGDMVNVYDPVAVGYNISDLGSFSDPKDSDKNKAYMIAGYAQVNQKNRRVRMEKEVTLHTSNGIWLTSPVLYWLPDEKQFISEEPVRIETDHMLIRGIGAKGSSELKNAKLERDIELIMNPGPQDSVSHRDHVTITCDGPLSFDYENNTATFEENVHLKDPKGELFSDRLVAYLDKNTRTIYFAQAEGNVRIIQGGQTANSKKAIYEPLKGKITLVGSPSLIINSDGSQAFPFYASSDDKDSQKAQASP
jgi:lipopolysaccharide export system protein LptA